MQRILQVFVIHTKLCYLIDPIPNSSTNLEQKLVS
jgi:hypothetical protein